MMSLAKLWWGLAGIVLGLIVLAYQWPVSVEPAQTRAREFVATDLPTLPVADEAELDEQISVVGQLSLFAGDATGSGGTIKGSQGRGNSDAGDSPWRIAGVFVVDSQALVVVSFDDPAKAPMELRVGDQLPSGELIQAIDGNGIFVQTAAGEEPVYRAMDAVGREKPGNT